VGNALTHRLQNILDYAYCKCYEKTTDQQQVEHQPEKGTIFIMSSFAVPVTAPQPRQREAAEMPKKELCHIWLDGLGDFLNQKNNFFENSNEIGYRSNTGGVVGGIDFNFVDYLYVG